MSQRALASETDYLPGFCVKSLISKINVQEQSVPSENKRGRLQLHVAGFSAGTLVNASASKEAECG